MNSPRPAARQRSAACWLIDAYARRAHFAPLPGKLAPRSVAEAYAIQANYVHQKALLCGPSVGRKIALSSSAMQTMTGLPTPISGRLHRRQVVGSPAAVRTSDYGRLIVEFEIAIRIGHDLAAASEPYDASSVAKAVAALGPALELADDRNADYGRLAGQGLALIADNAWNQGAVLGELREDWSRLSINDLTGEAFINGVSVGRGRGADLMRGPLHALAWLANQAAGMGDPLRAGEIAILGSMITSKFPQAGDRIEYRLEGFSPVVLQA